MQDLMEIGEKTIAGMPELVRELLAKMGED